MTLQELRLAAKQKQFVVVPATDYLMLLEKAYHVANTEPTVLGGDQHARLSLYTESALTLAKGQK